MMNLESLKEKKWLQKKVIIPAGIAAVFLLSCAYGIGYGNASTDINGQKMKYEEIDNKIKSAKEDLKKYQEKARSVHDEYLSKSIELDEAKEIAAKKDSITAEISKMNNDLESKKSESAKLDEDIKSKQAQIASLDNAIKEKQEAPVTLPAGQFLVGKDIKPGRYKVIAVGRGSNFQVYDSNGQNVVNTIIYSDKSDGLGVNEYVTVLSDGYMIDAHSSFKYIPVE